MSTGTHLRLWIFKVSLFKLTLDERFCQNQKEGRRTNPHSMEESEEPITGGFLFALSSPSLAMIPCLALTFPLTPMLPIFSAQYDSRCGALGTKSQVCSVIKYTATITHFVSGSCAFWP